jgi:hypothetical protein
LKKLAITHQEVAELAPPDRSSRYTLTYDDVHQKRLDAACVFFKECPTLQEICVGKQGLFEAEVFVRDAGARRGLKTVKVYRPGAGTLRVRNTMQYLRECWWRHGEMDAREFAKPDDQIDPGDLHRYYEMTLEQCRTSFFDAEWLLATKPLLASRPGGPWYR